MESRLFEIKGGKGKAWWRLYAGSMLFGLLFIWVYRVSYVPEAGEKGRWAWMAMFAAELCFSFYWLITLSVRWNPIYCCTYKDRLSQRYAEKLPMIDVFICTADPIIEPPIIVINTVLSVLAYDYPLEKLSVYLSDDGGSIFTFYALLEASKFAKSWIPFSRKFNLKHMSPALLFKKSSIQGHDSSFLEWIAMEKLYKEMESRINAAIKLGSISKEIRKEHEGFLEWSSKTTSKNHQAIVKVLIDGRDQNARDSEGFTMPTIIYMAREKHPKYRHNFKAGALNALLRVSEQISNGPIILTIDCDMCANNTESIRDALCIFMDEERGHEYAFVQFPQTYENTTKHDLYASSLKSIRHVDFPGLDGQGGPLYIGTCCFLMRDCLNGIKYNEFSNIDLRWERPQITEASISILEERTKNLATCSYEENTQWGKEMGLKYGCPVEDVITGFAIQCRGWKSAYLCPKREAFLGLAPITLSQALIQHKRWSDGNLQIFLSKYCPFFYGFRRTKLGLQMGYCIYSLWAINSIPTLIYVVIPSVCLLNEVSVFPNVTVLEAASHLLMFREWPINYPRFIDGLRNAGLDCVPQLQYIRLDHHLLTALVERWLPQTNTFHFAVGEMTVTLQDVAMILGVRIDGPPIIGPTVIGEGRRWLSWPDCCDELIGRHPEPDVVYHDPVQPHVTSIFRMGQAHARTCLPLHWLRWTFYRDLYLDLLDAEFLMHLGAYILFTIGCFILPDTSGSEVHLQYLLLLDDLSLFSRYSIGAALLAHLYRELNEATRPKWTNMAGCLHLLQV